MFCYNNHDANTCNVLLYQDTNTCNVVEYWTSTMTVIPGHGCVLHVLVCLRAPEQLEPPCSGSIQRLVLTVTPPPHVLVHVLQSVHDSNTPSTEK